VSPPPRCCVCSACLADDNYFVACGAEYLRANAGSTSSAGNWEKGDAWVCEWPLCHSCVFAACERYLRSEFKACKRRIVESFGALVSVVLLVVVADTGVFKADPPLLNLLFALGFTAVFLFGVIGLPTYSYRAIKRRSQRASLVSGGPVPEEISQSAIEFEAARLLSGGLLSRLGSGDTDMGNPLPESLKHRETILAVGRNYGSLLVKAPEDWRSWLKRRMPSTIYNDSALKGGNQDGG
jgi:hypothetical protein